MGQPNLAATLVSQPTELDWETLKPHVKEVDIHKYVDMLVYTLTDNSVILTDQFGYGEAENIEDAQMKQYYFWENYTPPDWALEIQHGTEEAV